jgi:MHS family proline/betaine transporter-like MFS transporter
MSSATVSIGLLPTYETGGWISLASLIILRLIQGLSAGGEFPINAAYMYEISQHDKSNSIFCSAINVSSLIGVLLGSLVTKIITTTFTHNEIIQGAWRIPFLLGLPLTFFIIWARKFMQDISPEQTKTENLMKDFFSRNVVNIIKGLILTAFLQVSFYILYIWMPSYLHYFSNFSSPRKIQTYNIISLTLLGGIALLAGYYAQFIKTKNLITFSIISTLILSLPTYKLLVSVANPPPIAHVTG